ncbi:hypothetical protein L3V83_12570 [Thiotrichales bacterium 19X7-9]|nr:hypothetical protein [Thiotrichales bacterium 19X7-9]
MSSIDDVVKAAQDLTDTVSSECDRIDEKLAELEALQADMEQREKDAWSPYWRLSRNQLGQVTDGNLNYFSKVNDCEVTFEVYRTIKTGIPWENRDQEEQEILTAMGKSGITYTQPEFNVVKMNWINKATDDAARTFLQQVIYHTWVTHGCYAKLINGVIRGSYFDGITSEWGICGSSILLKSSSYATPHPYAETDTGEVLFCMLGTIAGRFPISRSKPMWGFIPYVQQIED